MPKAPVLDVPPMDAAAVLAEPVVGVRPVAAPAPPPHTYTLHDAFSVLRQALAMYNQDDNMPAYLAAIESQIIYDNGGGTVTHPNCVAAWRQLVPLLEQAIGAALRIS